MDLLRKIIASKKAEVERSKQLLPVSRLESSPFFRQQTPSFYEAIAASGPSVITEFKRRSPSGGVLNEYAGIEKTAGDYQAAGASAISVLTDQEFFGGSLEDLEKAAGMVSIPLLRKDFIIDEYQLIESRAAGASAVLLIAAALSRKELKDLTGVALNLGLDVLFEIHDIGEAEKMNDRIRIIGVNNRNLSSLGVNASHAADLVSELPGNCLKVAESGIRDEKEAAGLHRLGYDGFLIGETFMRSPDPGKKALDFISNFKKIV